MNRKVPLIITFFVIIFHFWAPAQSVSRTDSLIISKGIQFQSWIRASQSSKDVKTPPRNTVIKIDRLGRYVKLQLPGTDPLHIAEIQVFSNGANIALGSSTEQSSIYAPGSGQSALAVDGNNDGNFANGSVNCTKSGNTDVEPWLKVDLGAVHQIDSICIWNRTDGGAERLKGFYLFVSADPFVSDLLSETISQVDVSWYEEPGNEEFPLGEELANSYFAPAYYERPMYNYKIHQQNPDVQWGLAQMPDASTLKRSPSTFEIEEGFLNSIQKSNIGNLSSICFGDEESYSTTNTGNLAAWFAASKLHYPSVLVHENQLYGTWSETQLRTFIRTAKPDIITYDSYYFREFGHVPGPDGTYTAMMMNDMSLYRKLALEGYDGTGDAPILFGGYLMGYKGSIGGANLYNYFPSESELNVGTYSYLLMGAKWLSSFRYVEKNPAVFFWTSADGTLLPQYWQYANIGKELSYLSPYLSRLETTDVRYISGQHMLNGSPVANNEPSNIKAWDSTAGPYITAISVSNLISGTNNGLKGDVAIGYFKPVKGVNTTNGLSMAPIASPRARYFMILNGLTKENGCCNPLGSAGLSADTIRGKADSALQRVSLTIDFRDRDIDTLYKISREDGTVRQVEMSHISGNKYLYEDTLQGGKADLFYWKNTDIINIDFNSDKTNIISGDSVSFFNLSDTDANYFWEFPGGTPMNSTEKDPVVIYNSPGTYNVTLKVSTGNNEDLILRKDFIVVDPPVGSHNGIFLDTGYVSAGDVTELNGAQSFTLETWVRFDSITSWDQVLFKMVSGTQRLGITTGGGDNSLYVFVCNGENTFGFTDANVISTNKWYHVAMVFDGTQANNAQRLKLFLNGVQQNLSFSGAIPATSSVALSSASFYAGSGTGIVADTHLFGTLDEVRVWNTSLTSEIIHGWKDSLVGFCHPNINNLKLYWTFDSISNPDVVKASQNTAYVGNVFQGDYVGSTQAITEPCLMTLPVKSIQLNAKRNIRGIVNLNWHTEGERDCVGYEIEKSVNMIDWDDIGFVKSKATDGRMENIFYNFSDPSALKESTLYRLKQIDYNGAHLYSKTVNVPYEFMDANLTVYPNPNTNGVIFIKGIEDWNKVSSIKMVDLNGRSVYKVKGDQARNGIKVQHLQAGVYFLQIFCQGNQVYKFKVIINK